MKKSVKENAAVKNSNSALIGNNLPLLDVENNTTTKSAKVKVSVSERDAREKYNERDIFSLCYEHLANVELESLRTSVNVSALKEAQKDGVSLSDFLANIARENDETTQRNLTALARSFILWYHNFSFLCGERELFKNKYRIRKANTNNFSITFQNEKTKETTSTYDGGAYFARPTTPTAAGIRTSFNSVQYTTRTLQDIQRKQENERIASEMRVNLVESGLISQELANILTPSQLKDIAAKLTKETAK